jgi:hypothetical protein
MDYSDFMGWAVLHHAQNIVGIVIIPDDIPLLILTDIQIIYSFLADFPDPQILINLCFFGTLNRLGISVITSGFNMLFAKRIPYFCGLKKFLDCFQIGTALAHICADQVDVHATSETMKAVRFGVPDKRRRVFLMERANTLHVPCVIILNFQKLGDQLCCVVPQLLFCFLDFFLVDQQTLSTSQHH